MATHAKDVIPCYLYDQVSIGMNSVGLDYPQALSFLSLGCAIHLIEGLPVPTSITQEKNFNAQNNNAGLLPASLIDDLK